jgi:hypothetical protein
MPDLRGLRGWKLGAEGIVVESAMSDERRAIRTAITHDGEAQMFACPGNRDQNG